MSGDADPQPGPGVEVLGDRRAPSKGERQRQAILDALVRLLHDHPIGDLTVGEIASEAGTGRSGFYVYFDSKFAALAVVTAEIWRDLMARADAFARLAEEPVDDYLRRIGAITLGVWFDHHAVLIASVQAMPLDEQLAALWRDWNARLSDILTAQVRADRERGLARPVVDDVASLVSTLHELTQHMFYLDRLHRNDEAQTAQMLETVRAIWTASAWGRPQA